MPVLGVRRKSVAGGVHRVYRSGQLGRAHRRPRERGRATTRPAAHLCTSGDLMPIRTIAVEGATWRVAPSGLLTANNRDEFGLLFVQGEGANKATRVTRYSPMT